VGSGLQLSSGRVIALGRLLFATLFLSVIWVDASQPAQFPRAAYTLLVAYVACAAVLVAVAWRSWWTDTRLAGPAHALDLVLFTIVVFLTQGDTSPYFIFCIFVLLAAAIRWGWRATTLTAVLLTLLYLLAGSLTIGVNREFELDRFLTRMAYLVILSLILIWFGVNQWRAGIRGSAEELLSDAAVDSPPLETALEAAMAGARAGRGAFVWSRKPRRSVTVLTASDGAMAESELDQRSVAPPAPGPFLYDLHENRALARDSERNLRRFEPGEQIRAQTAAALQLREGLAIPVRTDRGYGQLFLERVRGLSTDHLELGEEISRAVAAHVQRRALMKVAEENAESRSRLAIARDLHDSVVQFLAGAAFRLEAMKRSQASGREIASELNELKELMLLEQTELRSFITALRGGSQIELAELAKDLQSLANRLSRQWDVQCTFSAQASDMMVPTRLHFDAQQLVREAVANAVRHAGARNVSIRIGGEQDEMTLDFINDGASYPRGAGRNRMPGSLRERVEAAGGRLDLSRGMGVTKISIALPIAGKAA
jgi:signal transduction histidine kinase